MLRKAIFGRSRNTEVTELVGDDSKGHFHRRWGQGGVVFPCNSCGRRTRNVAQAAPGLCPECDEWLQIANGISDGAYPDPEDLAAAEALIDRLKRQALKKGGDAGKLGISHDRSEGA